MAGEVAMYCRQQGYLSPHWISYKIAAARSNCKGSCASSSSGTTLPWSNLIGVYVGFVQHKTPMIFITYPDHGCVYTLSQEDGDELYYAPIYANGSVNLEEFAPVDLDSADMDEMELFDIRNRLVEMCQI